LRFDPEGVRVSDCGDSVYVSDESGPFVYEFRIASGKRVRSLGVPNNAFAIDRSDLPGYTPQEVRHGRSCARHDDED
jgi:hypothetical protein